MQGREGGTWERLCERPTLYLDHQMRSLFSPQGWMLNNIHRTGFATVASIANANPMAAMLGLGQHMVERGLLIRIVKSERIGDEDA